tara:strand:+ start:1707 stop:2051 length:345 start_codon:yes stop_codon:yes gene_type:complete
MKRTPLKRKTPLKRGTSQLKRTPLNKVSKSKSSTERRNKYAKAKREYMHDRGSKKDYCERCEGKFGVDRLDLHHKAGRAGSKIYDKEFFAVLCRSCHDEVHKYPKQSREEGWLI